MRMLAPAKINVFLRITGRRPDGYHLLDSLMVPISLYDEIDLEAWDVGRGAWTENNTITVTCDDPTLPADETNLAYKAAALLGKETGVNARIAIALRKRIPAVLALAVAVAMPLRYSKDSISFYHSDLMRTVCVLWLHN